MVFFGFHCEWSWRVSAIVLKSRQDSWGLNEKKCFQLLSEGGCTSLDKSEGKSDRRRGFVFFSVQSVLGFWFRLECGCSLLSGVRGAGGLPQHPWSPMLNTVITLVLLQSLWTQGDFGSPLPFSVAPALVVFPVISSAPANPLPSAPHLPGIVDNFSSIVIDSLCLF